MGKIISIVGARPNFVKLSSNFSQLIVHTGQHYDAEMSQAFFEGLKLPMPKYNLGLRGDQLGEMITELTAIYKKERPDLVIIFGDTNSTSAGAIAAFPLRIPVAHIEAGLRGGNWLMLEEYNRVISDHIASINFAPTKTAARNLKREGIANGYFVGDVMYDRILAVKKDLGKIDVKHQILLTTHRAENVDRKEFLTGLFEALSGLEQTVLFPIHPRTEKMVIKFKIKFPSNFKIVKPMGYLETVRAAVESEVVVTDSGGLQKEAYFLEKPCLILRNETEWVEIIDNKSVYLIGTEKFGKIGKLIKKGMLPPKVNHGEFGKGDAWSKIKKILINKGYYE